MAKAKPDVATRRPREKDGKAPSEKAMTPDRPPESAEDFAHVLRRLVTARNQRPAKA